MGARIYTLPLASATVPVRLSDVYQQTSLDAYGTRVLADGAVAYWPLDDPAASPTARDRAGTRVATLHGAITCGVAGVGGGRAMDFRGGYLTASALPSIQPPFTWELWAWVRVPDNRHMLSRGSEFGETGAAEWSTQFPGSDLHEGFDTYQPWTSLEVSESPLSLATWHHLVLTSDGQVTRFYRDAVLQLEAAQTYWADVEPATAFETVIGGATWNANAAWDGLLQDVAVYPRALPLSEIRDHYTLRTVVPPFAATDIPYRELTFTASAPLVLGRPPNGAGPPLLGLSLTPGSPGGSAYAAQVAADGATHHWRLNDASGLLAADRIAGGANAPGTLSGGVTPGQPGPLTEGATAMGFNGTTGKVQSAPITLPVSCTLELWTKWSGGGADGVLLSTRSIASGDTFILYVSGNWLAFFGSGFVSGSISVKDTAWHHIVAVMNGATCALYVDGAPDSSGNNLRATPTSGPLAIAADFSNAGWWTGALADVAVYPTALTPGQIAAHYALRSAPVAASGAATPLTLGPFATGPLKLSDLYALGATGTLTIVGVPY